MKNAMSGDAFLRNGVVSACCAPSPIGVMITPSGFYLKSPILRVSSTLTASAVYPLSTFNFRMMTRF